MKKAVMIVNPKAGVKKKKEQLSELAHGIFERQEIGLDVVTLKSGTSISEVVDEHLEKNYNLFVVAGGDGTINEVANSLWNKKGVLGVVPIGSGNGFARSLSIPQGEEEALKVIARGNTVRIDRGVVNNHPFYCTFGLGFDAVVSQRFSTERRRGRTTYIKDALLEYLRFIPDKYIIEFDRHKIEMEAMVVAVCNSPQYGNNAYIAPGAKMSDGLLDITIVRPGNIFTETIAGIELFTRRLDDNILVESFKAERLKILRKKEGAAQIDGEAVTMSACLDVVCEKRGLEVAVPV